MENIYENITSITKYKVDPEQFVIEGNILIDNGENLLKVLAINSNVNLDMPYEVLNNECSLVGKIFTNIVYITNNGEINNQTTTIPFTHKILNSNISPNSKLNFNIGVISSEMEKISNGQIKVLTTIGLDCIVLNNNDTTYLKETEAETYVKQQECKVVSLSSQKCERFEEKFECTIKNGVKKILMTDVGGVLKEWNIGHNFISFEAEMYLKILYINNQDVAEIQTVSLSKIVKQEIEADGISKEVDVDLYLNIIHDNIETILDVSESGETNIIVNVPMLICYNSYVKKSVFAITDAYSTKAILSIENGIIENDESCMPEILEGKVEGNVTLNEESRIDKYLATTNVITCVSNYYVKDETICIEGIVTANVLYINDELDSIQSVQIEIPYVLNKEVKGMNDCKFIEPSVCVFDVDVMVKRGKEIYFDAKVKSFVNLTKKCEKHLISKIEQLSDIPVRKNAVEIYFAKAGESFWSIAKNLKIPTEMISNQNPDLVDPLEKDQNIALYFQKK